MKKPRKPSPPKPWLVLMVGWFGALSALGAMVLIYAPATANLEMAKGFLTVLTSTWTLCVGAVVGMLAPRQN